MAERLAGKRAFITGGSGGLGAAIAEAYAHEGARVALAGRNRERLEAVARRMPDTGGDALVCPVDVRDASRVAATLSAAHDQMGGLDILISGAAIDTGWAPAGDM